MASDKTTLQAVHQAIDDGNKPNRKFAQTIDLVITLKNIDMNEAKNRIDEEIMLPHGRGTKPKIAIFASGQLAQNAKKHVDLLIKPEEIEDLAKDKKSFKKIVNEFDFFIAEAPLMPTIGKTLGVVLGPRGKMPRPVPPQIDISGITKNLQKTIKIRSKSNKTFHAIAGKDNMEEKQIAENIDTIIKRLVSKLERGKLNISSVYVKTTMGPSVRVL